MWGGEEGGGWSCGGGRSEQGFHNINDVGQDFKNDTKSCHFSQEAQCRSALPWVLLFTLFLLLLLPNE